MTIDCKGSEIKYFAGYICIPSPAEQQGEVIADKDYTVTIKRKTRRRSLDANAYYWKLCGELAKKMCIPAYEVYRRHVVGVSNYETYCMITDAVGKFAELWCSDHYGRQIETRASKIKGCVTVFAYYGSSDFDTTQMATLIDNCVQDCKALGIETRPQEEIESLLSQWKEAKDAEANQSDEHTAQSQSGGI